MKTSLLSFAFAAVLSISAVPPAHAADEEMLARLKALAVEQGTFLSWDSVEEYPDAEGKDVTTLVNARIGKGDDTVELSNLELRDIEAREDGWRLGSVRIPHQRTQDGETVIDVFDLDIAGLVLPRASTPDAIPVYDAVTLREVNASRQGRELFVMNDFHVELTSEPGDGPMEFSGAAEAFRIGLDAVEDPKQRAIIEALGYEKLEGFFEMGGSWNPADGTLDLSQYDITINDAGMFGIALKLGGYTRDFIASLRQVSAQMSPEQGADNSAANMAMLGLMQQLTFHSARIQFFDDSLTDRVLGFFAAQQGKKPEEIADTAKAMVPFALMPLNNAEFSEQAAEAISTFLDSPQNIAIVAEPASPVPFAMLVAAAAMAPQTLPQQLSIKVIPNQ